MKGLHLSRNGLQREYAYRKMVIIGLSKGNGRWLSKGPLFSDSIFFGRKYLSIVDPFETNSWDADLNKVGLMWGSSHKIKKDLQNNPHKSLNSLVRPARFELATYGFVVRRSVRAELRAHENLIEICIINKL